jgi:hypothetical protein
MTSNVVSFEDQRLARLGTVFDARGQKLAVAKTIAELEARTKESETVRDYVERQETGEVMLLQLDASTPSAIALAQLIDLLAGYDTMLISEIDRLEDEVEMFDRPHRD